MVKKSNTLEKVKMLNKLTDEDIYEILDGDNIFGKIQSKVGHVEDFRVDNKKIIKKIILEVDFGGSLESENNNGEVRDEGEFTGTVWIRVIDNKSTLDDDFLDNFKAINKGIMVEPW